MNSITWKCSVSQDIYTQMLSVIAFEETGMYRIITLLDLKKRHRYFLTAGAVVNTCFQNYMDPLTTIIPVTDRILLSCESSPLTAQ